MTLAGDDFTVCCYPGPIGCCAGVTIVTWVVAALRIAPLADVTVRWFAGIGWPTVFPLGMYASATYAMYVELDWAWLTWVLLCLVDRVEHGPFVAVAPLGRVGLLSKRGLK